MPGFRWPYVAQDIALATKAAAVRPRKLTEWEDIAKTLTSLFSTADKHVLLKGRGMQGSNEPARKKTQGRRHQVIEEVNLLIA